MGRLRSLRKFLVALSLSLCSLLFLTLLASQVEQRLVRVEYQKEGEESWSPRVVEPYFLERQLPNWYVHTWDRTSDGARTFRLDRMRNAELLDERFEPRADYDPNELGGTLIESRSRVDPAALADPGVDLSKLLPPGQATG